MNPSIPLNIVKWLLEYNSAKTEAEKQKKLKILCGSLIEKYKNNRDVKIIWDQKVNPAHTKRKIPAIILFTISEIENIVFNGGNFADIKNICEDLYSAILVAAQMDSHNTPKWARPFMIFNPFTAGLVIMDMLDGDNQSEKYASLFLEEHGDEILAIVKSFIPPYKINHFLLLLKSFKKNIQKNWV
jgi:hypothetical protein